MERLKLAGKASEQRSACMFAGGVCCTSNDTNVARTFMHCCCEQNTVSFLFDETTIVLSARLTRSYKKSKTNPRKKRRMDSSALVSWRLTRFFLQDDNHISRNLEVSFD